MSLAWSVLLASAAGWEVPALFADGPTWRLAASSFAQPEWVEAGEGDRVCSARVRHSGGAVTTELGACSERVRAPAAAALAEWTFDASDGTPEGHLLTVSFAFPTATDPRHAVFVGAAVEVLRIETPPDVQVTDEPDCGLGADPQPVAVAGPNHPYEVCSVAVEVDVFGTARVGPVTDCPDELHSEARERAIGTRARWCPAVRAGAPEPTVERARVQVFYAERAMERAGPDLRLREAFPPGPPASAG